MIRTYVNGVLGMSQLLTSASTTSELLTYSKEIRTPAEALVNVVSDVVDTLQIVQGKVCSQSWCLFSGGLALTPALSQHTLPPNVHVLATQAPVIQRQGRACAHAHLSHHPPLRSKLKASSSIFVTASSLSWRPSTPPQFTLSSVKASRLPPTLTRRCLAVPAHALNRPSAVGSESSLGPSLLPLLALADCTAHESGLRGAVGVGDAWRPGNDQTDCAQRLRLLARELLRC